MSGRSLPGVFFFYDINPIEARPSCAALTSHNLAFSLRLRSLSIRALALRR
jgi:hypothetical protein